MRHIHVHDRYAETPPESWLGRRWQSTADSPAAAT